MHVDDPFPTSLTATAAESTRNGGAAVVPTREITLNGNVVTLNAENKFTSVGVYRVTFKATGMSNIEVTKFFDVIVYGEPPTITIVTQKLITRTIVFGQDVTISGMAGTLKWSDKNVAISTIANQAALNRTPLASELGNVTYTLVYTEAGTNHVTNIPLTFNILDTAVNHYNKGTDITVPDTILSDALYTAYDLVAAGYTPVQCNAIGKNPTSLSVTSFNPAQTETDANGKHIFRFGSDVDVTATVSAVYTQDGETDVVRDINDVVDASNSMLWLRKDVVPYGRFSNERTIRIKDDMDFTFKAQAFGLESSGVDVQFFRNHGDVEFSIVVGSGSTLVLSPAEPDGIGNFDLSTMYENVSYVWHNDGVLDSNATTNEYDTSGITDNNIRLRVYFTATPKPGVTTYTDSEGHVGTLPTFNNVMYEIGCRISRRRRRRSRRGAEPEVARTTLSPSRPRSCAILPVSVRGISMPKDDSQVTRMVN